MTSVTHAQLFSFQANTKTSPAQTPGKPAPALSADDFKSKVATKSQQAQQELFQQAQSNLKQQSSQMPLPNSPPKAPKLNASPLQQQQSPAPASSSPNTQTPPPESVPAATQDTSSTTTTTTQTTTQPAPAPNAANAANTTPPPAPTQNQIYTGFGASPTNKSTTAPSSQSSGGWNIKY